MWQLSWLGSGIPFQSAWSYAENRLVVDKEESREGWIGSLELADGNYYMNK